MPRVAPRVPELSEVLCNSCGYVLDGIDSSGVCPECGKPISQSIGSERLPPAWETIDNPHRFNAFVETSRKIIFQPALFYRTLNVRGTLESSRSFAKRHWWIASVLFGLTGATHAVWFSYRVMPVAPNVPGGRPVAFAFMFVALTLLTYACLDLITRLAGRLTTWEATYRGLRLPYNIVLRGMYYHAAHYLPVAMVAATLVEGYQLVQALFSRWLPFNAPMIYLYALCALVVLSAVYLFQTYWIGMRNMMYANR